MVVVYAEGTGQADPVQMRRMMLGDSTGTMSTEHMDAAMRSVQLEKDQSAMIEAMKACRNCIPPKVSFICVLMCGVPFTLELKISRSLMLIL